MKTFPVTSRNIYEKFKMITPTHLRTSSLKLAFAKRAETPVVT